MFDERAEEVWDGPTEELCAVCYEPVRNHLCPGDFVSRRDQSARELKSCNEKAEKTRLELEVLGSTVDALLMTLIANGNPFVSRLRRLRRMIG